MDYAKIAEQVIQYVGGKKNIKSVAHCATRLRFQLRDNSLRNEEALSDLEGVKGVFLTQSQFQIIFGSGTVNLVCAEVQKQLGTLEEQASNEKEEKSGNAIQRFIKMLSDIFVPIIPAIVAGGLLMGLNNVLTSPLINGSSVIELYPQWAGLATAVNTFASAPFTFLPVLIGFSATKKFGGNAFLGAAGLPGFISMKPEDYGHFAIGLILSMAVSFGLTVVFWKKMGIEKETAEVEAKTTDADKEAEVNSDVKATTDEIKPEAVVTEPEETAETAQENQELTFTSPMKGKVLPVTESADEMFASKMLGDGIAVEAADGTVYAPCDGTVSLLFPTKHAVGIKSADGVELLIHVGINTVQLDGEGFEAFVTQGDTVKKGDKLLKADLDFIREKGLNPQTMMIFPEAMNLDITPLSSENADENTAAVKVTRK